MAEDGKPAFSFGFSKKVETKKLSKSAVSETTDNVKAETDFVLSLEGNEVKTTVPKEKEKGPYVIPLIKKNRWREGTEKRLADVKKEIDPDDLDQQAARELLEETAKYNESWEDRDKADPNLAIPLLMQNKVPEGYETDEKLNVDLRPEEPDDADYEQIPIEHFGVAMLRGMGWKEGQGIGKNGKVIAPVEAHLRPKGLGLGADRRQATGNKDKNPDKKSEDNKDDDLVMKKGAFCVILSGKHKDLYGVVEGVDEDNARLVIKLALSGQSITLTQYNVKLVGKKEYDKYSKYLNKGKADKYKEEQQQNGHDDHSKSKSRDTDASSSRDRDDDRSHRDRSDRSDRDRSDRSDKDRKDGSDRDKHRNKDDKSRKRKHERDDRSSRHKSDSPPSSKSHHTDSGRDVGKLWLQKDLRVRIIDKHYKKGKYYKEKVVVVDVISLDNTVCRTDDGKVLDHLTHDQLETVIPRQEDAHVMVCAGQHRGQLGKVVKRNKDAGQALVQLLADRDKILQLDFNAICEYVGSIDDKFDY